MNDPKVETWMSGGVEVEVETWRNVATVERWCNLHDETVRAMKIEFPED